MLKIISVGADFPKFPDTSFDSNISLTDYDVLIINPEHVARSFPAPSSVTEGKNYISGDNRVRLSNLIQYRRSEVDALLRDGKIIISFLTPRYEVRLTKDGKTLSSYNNYSWLPGNYDQHFVNSIIDSQGSVLNLVDKKNPFANYYHAFKDIHYFTAYLSQSPSEFKYGKGFLTNSTGHITGFYTELLNGIVVFLPKYNFRGELRQKFAGVLLSILKTHFGFGVPTAPPDWVNSYQIPGTDQLNRKIFDIQNQIQLLEEKKSEIEENRNSLEEFKVLLYEQSHILEKKVVDAFRLLGFSAETITAENTDYDVVIEAEEGRAIAEVEGKDDGAIHKEKIDQLLSAINQDGAGRDDFAKGIIIGNHYRKKKPEDREFPFTDTVKKLAKQYHYALLTTVDLFNAVLYILEHPSDEDYKTSCREAIFQADGILVAFPDK